jgi:formamidopyrimidine-DNA glycosylase
VLGIDPSRPGKALAPAERAALWDVLAAMLARGVADGRIITVEPREVGRRSRRTVLRREATYVYGRERCLRCDREIARVALGGRPCAFCPGCQAAG